MSETTEKHWSENEKWQNWYHGGAARAARECGALPASTNIDKPLTDAGYVRLMQMFMAEQGPLTKFDKGEDAATMWKLWLKDLTRVTPSEDVTLSCSVTKTFGGVTVSFGYSATFNITPEQTKRAYDYCHDMVEEQFSRWVQHELPTVPAPAQTSAAQPALPVKFNAVSLNKENRAGVDYYKIKGGQFAKWGVRVWPETLQQAGVNLDALDYGDNPFSGCCTVLMNGDKPQKVLVIE